MRFMVLLKIDAERGLEAVRAYDAELSRAGVADSARLAARGARLAIDEVHGEILAGFWVYDLDSRDDAAAWMRRCPAPRAGGVEIRVLLEPTDVSERPAGARSRPAWERAMVF